MEPIDECLLTKFRQSCTLISGHQIYPHPAVVQRGNFIERHESAHRAISVRNPRGRQKRQLPDSIPIQKYGYVYRICLHGKRRRKAASFPSDGRLFEGGEKRASRLPGRSSVHFRQRGNTFTAVWRRGGKCAFLSETK